MFHTRGGLALAALLVCAPRAAGALPLLSEVLYDAAGADDGGVFVELFGTPGASLDGLVLQGVNGANGAPGPVLTLSGRFPDDGFFVVADARADGSSDVAAADLLLDFDLQNGPDSLRLLSGDSVLDALGYGVFGAGDVFAGEGSAAPDAAAGSSLARHFADLDRDDNALDFAVLDAPTPGQGPRAAVPEPGSGAALALGLTGLAWAARRRRRR